MLIELFEIELFICIKIDLALNNLQVLICHKTQTNTQTNKLNQNKRNQTLFHFLHHLLLKSFASHVFIALS